MVWDKYKSIGMNINHQIIPFCGCNSFPFCENFNSSSTTQLDIRLMVFPSTQLKLSLSIFKWMRRQRANLVSCFYFFVRNDVSFMRQKTKQSKIVFWQINWGGHRLKEEKSIQGHDKVILLSKHDEPFKTDLMPWDSAFQFDQFILVVIF